MTELQSCPDVSLLQRLLDGLLTDEEQAGLNEHLAECSACQERLDGLIAGQGFWSDVARNLKSAHAEIEAGTATRHAPRPGEALDQADDDLTLEFLDQSDKPESLGRLGHYEVLEVIGRGGMGIVLRAFDERLHRVVAIKVMAPRLAATSPPRKRFLREARAAAQVRHENVIDIHAVEEQPIPHLVMEFVPGESLQQRLDRIGPLEVSDVLRIGQQIARGLAAAHAQGLIHRDVKPGNVLLENGIEERVKITDFGLARAADDASMTQSGIIAGTPLYMAPEQAQGGAIDHRADLFSFGSVLYTMASGRPPFRAPTSLAVLKRVVEDAPRPIQEIIPEVPQWLCDIICKLHAKRPEDRFQSAKEVADLLGQCLANGQPSADANFRSPVTRDGRSAGCKLEDSKPVTKSQIPNPQSQIGQRHWALAAVAAVVFLFVCLSLTEATGVTQVAATVIRLLTPEGTLVVETNDPDVKITIEGDGGLVITGAGLHEVRLKPGSYKLQADKNGQPVALEREVVSITQGGRQVVRVKLETPPAAAVAQGEKGAFVLLGGAGVAERKFDTLAEAVLAASDGDTIEIRGNGPFVSPPVAIRNRALTIRSGEGFRPVIKADPDEPGNDLLSTNAPLVLEGLDFQWLDAKAFAPQSRYSRLVASTGSASRLHVANCRFLMNRREGRHDGMACVFASDAPLCRLRNCQLFICGHGAVWGGTNLGVVSVPNGELMIDNCQIVGNGVVFQLTDAEPMTVIQKHNTFLGSPTSHLALWPAKEIDAPSGTEDHRPFRMETSANILGGHVQFSQYAALLASEKRLRAEEVEEFLQQWIGWRENRNLYLLPEDSDLLQLVAEMPPGQYTRPTLTAPLKSLADWQHFWGMPELDSLRGQARFQGGDLLTKAGLTPDLLTPDDFRLRADSAGYRAGPDGKDLGTDVDLVGPGAAYERWKKTPEYQEWLKDTGQLRAEAPKPEAKAFVLLGGQGVAQRKFDTLADAVQHAGDGETMEIRGNGPFVTKPIAVYERSLIIRAGAGFRPLIMLDPDEPKDCMIRSNAPLVLEGLELQWVNANPPTPESRGSLIKSSGPKAQLHAANCRFLMNRRDGANQTLLCVDTWDSLATTLRNCQCIVAGHGNVGGTVIQSNYSQIAVDNCLCHGTGVKWQVFQRKPSKVLFSRNTILPLAPVSIGLSKQLVLPLGDGSSPPIEVEMSASVVATPVIWINQWRESLDQKQDLSASAAEFLQRLVAWRGRGNCFLISDKELVELAVDFNLTPSTPPVKTLDDWKRFWSLGELDAQLAQAGFQGGNLAAKGAATPELLTPEDYRLREDSPGYRAGPDGKDLGADVDLVGPGPAYERWKKTPEYQEWLKETGQEK